MTIIVEQNLKNHSKNHPTLSHTHVAESMIKEFVILGPTSSGKTSLALKLCQKFGGVIVSVDSRQIYKYFDIGTGKIPLDSKYEVKKEHVFWGVDGTKIYGYDIADAKEYFSVVDFIEFVSSLNLEGNVFYVGGTGFYFDVLLGNKKVSNVLPNEDLRKELSIKNINELYKILLELNKKRAEKIDRKNKVRLIRAIEIEKADKKPQTKSELIITNPLIFGLTASRECLYKRVDSWVEKAFDSGFLEETRGLLNQGYGGTSIMQGLNYKSAVKFLNKELTLEEAMQRAKFDNHAYIRRQLTYFRKMKNVNWLDIQKEDFDTSIFKLVQSKLNE